MELKCYLLNRMVEAKEAEIALEGGGKCDVYYCNLCGARKCMQDKKLADIGGLIAFEGSLIPDPEAIVL